MEDTNVMPGVIEANRATHDMKQKEYCDSLTRQ